MSRLCWSHPDNGEGVGAFIENTKRTSTRSSCYNSSTGGTDLAGTFLPSRHGVAGVWSNSYAAAGILPSGFMMHEGLNEKV